MSARHTDADGKKWIDVELHDTQIEMYRPYADLIYNPIMAILDDQTEYVSGMNGDVNNMRVYETVGDFTTVQFLHYKKMTDNHVDVAETVGQVRFHRTDLENFYKMLGYELDSLHK